MLAAITTTLVGFALVGGTILMCLASLYAFVLAFDCLSTRIIERALRTFDVYAEFLAFAMPRVRARWTARRKRRNEA